MGTAVGRMGAAYRSALVERDRRPVDDRGAPVYGSTGLRRRSPLKRLAIRANVRTENRDALPSVEDAEPEQRMLTDLRARLGAAALDPALTAAQTFSTGE